MEEEEFDAGAYKLDGSVNEEDETKLDKEDFEPPAKKLKDNGERNESENTRYELLRF